MLKNIGLYSFSFFLISSVSHAMLLVDVPEDQESQQKIIRSLKKNTFPNISVNDQETIADLTNHFSTFSNGTLLQTPESTFFAKKLLQKGIDRPVIHIPNTIYDLEVMYNFFTDKNFYEEATKNSQRGIRGLNNVGINDSSITDNQFLSLSKNIFQIFNAYTTEDDFIKHAIKRVGSIHSLEKSTDNNLLASTKKLLSNDYLDFILGTISHELQSQKEGKINFYRTSGGLVYNEDLADDELRLSQHPHRQPKIKEYISILRHFFCTTGANTRQSLAESMNPNTKMTPLPLETPLNELLTVAKEYNHWIWGDVIQGYAHDISGVGKIVDYPFDHEPGQINPHNLQVKELSYSYSLLGGFIFDGVHAAQSACSFVYATGDKEKYPYFYALSYKLPDFYTQYAPCFNVPQTPLYQGIVDSGEDFHPRFQLKIKGTIESELSDFYGNIKILGLFGEDAETRKNKLFTQGLETRHNKLIAHTKEAEKNFKNNIFFPVPFKMICTDDDASGMDVGLGNGISDYFIHCVRSYMSEQKRSEILQNILSLNPDEEIRIKSEPFSANAGEKVKVTYDIGLYDSGLALNLLDTNKKAYIGNSYSLSLHPEENKGALEFIIPEESSVSLVLINKKLGKEMGQHSCSFRLNDLKIEKTSNK